MTRRRRIRDRAAAAAALAFSLLVAVGCGRAPVERVEWPAMGTVAAVQAKGPGAAKDLSALRESVQADFAAVERLLNAHDPKSQIRLLAHGTDAEVLARCDAAMRPCYAAAFALKRLSGGTFDPRWRGPGTLDLGAIAKGFAVDRAAERASAGTEGEDGGADALIDLGGNLKAVRGAWTAGVRAPDGEGAAAVVTLRPGEALATSATYFRGAHIVDGRTGRPVSSGVASATVLCESAMWADGLSTTLFALGPDDGRRFLREMRTASPAVPCPTAVLWLLSDGRRAAFDPDGRFR